MLMNKVSLRELKFSNTSSNYLPNIAIYPGTINYLKIFMNWKFIQIWILNYFSTISNLSSYPITNHISFQMEWIGRINFSLAKFKIL